MSFGLMCFAFGQSNTHNKEMKSKKKREKELAKQDALREPLFSKSLFGSWKHSIKINGLFIFCGANFGLHKDDSNSSLFLKYFL